MNQHREYKYQFTDNQGHDHAGTAVLYSDKEAVDYFRSLEKNGGIKVQSLKRNERQIWRYGE